MNKLYFLALIFFSLALTGVVQAQNATFLVDVSANPSSGPAPLRHVDFSAGVTGSATGDITYRFDCTGDGRWDHAVTTSSTSYAAYDICTYPTPGTYTAKVKAERGGLSFLGRIDISVFANAPVAPVVVPAVQTPTSVSTGMFSLSRGALLLTFVLALGISYIMLLRFYIKTHVLPKALQAKAERDLSKAIERIKKREDLG